MARIRTIKPELFVSETLAQVSLAAERTFTGLLTQADDRGRFRYNAAVLNGALWPLRPDHTPDDFANEIDELVAVGALCCYHVDGKQYAHFPTWEDHQRISHPSTKLLSPQCPHHDAVNDYNSDENGDDTTPKTPSHEGITENLDVKNGKFPEPSGDFPEPSGKTPYGRERILKGKGSLEKEEEKEEEGEKPTRASARPRAAKKPEPQPTEPSPRRNAKSKTKSAATATDASTVTDDFLTSVRGMGNRTKVQAVVTKALTAGYSSDATLSALQQAHQDGKPLTAEVLHQYLEGFQQQRKGKPSNKSIHYAADAPKKTSDFSEDL